LVLGFALLILLGGLLLTLPFASRDGVSVGFIDALFTATSASCVTGQTVVVNATQWTWFGKLVIILLIQIGGLGVMTIVAVAMMLFNFHISLRDRLVIQSSFNQDGTGGMVNLIRYVIRTTLIIEGVGAVFLAIGFYTSSEIEMGLGQSVVYGMFHSVSAFCNAGFDIIGGSSLAPYVENPIINLTIMALIISGGLGYPVWIETAGLFRTAIKKNQTVSHLWKRFSVHSKIVISMTAFLVFGGAFLFFLLEWDNPLTLGGLSLKGKTLASLFQSVMLRTAGFTTIDQAGLNGSSLFLSCVLMIIGGSPAGTAGGIKTVTFGILCYTMINAVKGRDRITVFNRELTLHALQKAMTVMSMLLVTVFVSATVLRFTEHLNPFPHTFLDLLFETSSTSATVGVTTGITPYLTAGGKVTLIVSMFIGRLGPTTLALALTAIYRKANAGGDKTLAKANVIIG
jgi:trk system potassium uptake protein TrkH